MLTLIDFVIGIWASPPPARPDLEFFVFRNRFSLTVLCSAHIKTQKWKWAPVSSVFGLFGPRVRVSASWMTNIDILVQWKPGNSSQPNKRRREKLSKKSICFCAPWITYKYQRLKALKDTSKRDSEYTHYHRQRTIGFGYGCQRDYDTHSQCELSILDQILL